MTIGDVFSVVAAICGIFLTSWATVVAMVLLFPNASERARLAIRQPKRSMLRGFGILITIGLFAVVTLANPAPPVKLVGWMLTLFLLGISYVGTAGIALEAGRRIQAMQPEMPAYPAFVRGAAYVVGSTILPLLGWFAIAPLLFIASLGAGWKAAFVSASRVPEV